MLLGPVSIIVFATLPVFFVASLLPAKTETASFWAPLPPMSSAVPGGVGRYFVF